MTTGARLRRRLLGKIQQKWNFQRFLNFRILVFVVVECALARLVPFYDTWQAEVGRLDGAMQIRADIGHVHRGAWKLGGISRVVVKVRAAVVIHIEVRHGSDKLSRSHAVADVFQIVRHRLRGDIHR